MKWLISITLGNEYKINTYGAALYWRDFIKNNTLAVSRSYIGSGPQTIFLG